MLKFIACYRVLKLYKQQHVSKHRLDTEHIMPFTVHIILIRTFIPRAIDTFYGLLVTKKSEGQKDLLVSSSNPAHEEFLRMLC